MGLGGVTGFARRDRVLFRIRAASRQRNDMVERRPASGLAATGRQEHGDCAIGATPVLTFHMPDEPIVPVKRRLLRRMQRLRGLDHEVLFQRLLNPPFGWLIARHGAIMKSLPGQSNQIVTLPPAFGTFSGGKVRTISRASSGIPNA